MVQAGGVAGFGAYSDAVTAKTKDNEFSQECRETLLAMADGSYVSPGSIVAIVFGVIAFLLLCGGGLYFLKKRQPPPPPPAMKPPPAAY